MKLGKSRLSDLNPPSFGFTLVELMAAVAVLAILTAALLSAVTGVSLTWQKAESQIEMRQNGRAIIDYMSRELKAASLPIDRSNNQNLQFVENPDSTTTSGAPTSETFLNPQGLFFQIPVLKPMVVSGAVQSGSVSNVMAEVGYFVRWDTTSYNNPRGCLCRLFIPPYNYTASGSYTAGSANADYLIGTRPTAWLTDAIINTAAPGTIIPGNQGVPSSAGRYQGLFADNVIALWARCLDANGATIVNTAAQTGANSTPSAYDAPYVYDSRQGYSYTPAGGSLTMKNGFYNTQTSSSQILATLPATVEVALVILSSRGASRLTSIPTYNVTQPTSTSNTFWTDLNAFVNGLPKNVQPETSVYSAQISLETSN